MQPINLYYFIMLVGQRQWGQQYSGERQRLVKELFRVWSSQDVSQQYQDFYLMYLQTVPVDILESVMTKEIRDSLQHRNYYFRMETALKERQKALVRLQQLLTKYAAVPTISESVLQILCEGVDEVRSSAVAVAEIVVGMKMHCLKYRLEPILLNGYNRVLEDLDKSQEFIKRSLLTKYIRFATSYDPFLLNHYQIRQKRTLQNEPHCISKLFSMPISKAYRLIQLKQQMVEFMCGRKPREQPKQFSPPKDEGRFSSLQARNITLESTDDHFFKMPRSQTEPTESLQSQFDKLNVVYKKQDHPRQMRGRVETMPSTPSQEPFYLPRISAGYSQMVSSKKESPRQNKHIKKYLYKIRRPVHKNSYETEQDDLPVNRINLITKNTEVFKEDVQKIIPRRPINRKPSVCVEEINSLPVHRQAYRSEDAIPHRPKLRVGVARQRQNSLQPSHLPASPTPLFPSQVRNLKIKAGSIGVEAIFRYLRELRIKSEYRTTFEVMNWENSLRHNQYYLHKFYVNDRLQAISLCCALPQANILIKYWGPLALCSQDMSSFLFGKYLQHIQKTAPFARQINYNAAQIGELTTHGFNRIKDRVWKRARKIPCPIDTHSYVPFLTLRFSNLAIPKSYMTPDLERVTIPSNRYSYFGEDQFFCFNYLLIANKLSPNSLLSTVGSYSQRLGSMKEVQQTLLRRQIDSRPFDCSVSLTGLNLLIINMKNVLRRAYFVAKRPYFKLHGEVMYSDKESLVTRIELFRCKTRLYFAKGFSSLTAAVSLLRQLTPPTQPRVVQFCVRMFSKRLRGRIAAINLRDEVCFGELEVIWEWMDYLKGRVEHQFDYQTYGDDEQFYVMVEMQGEKVMAFRVSHRDFI